MLLCAALKQDRAFVLAHFEYLPADHECDTFNAMLDRAANGEPIAYILGKRAFYDRDFFVMSSVVLIPRPETELLVEWMLAFFAPRADAITLADIGTGSGAIAVTLAANLPHASVHAVDLSEDALAIAHHNVSVNHVGHRVTLFHGNLLDPLIAHGSRYDGIAANLPYIPRDEVPTLAVSRYEPVVALDGGEDGLSLVRRVIADAPQVLHAGAPLMLEIGIDQAAVLRAAFDAGVFIGFDRFETVRDYAQIERFVILWRA
jgi:release factor glutamine methyltransferase